MGSITVEIRRDYKYAIDVEYGSLDHLDRYRTLFFRYEKAVIITDEKVASYYLKSVERQIDKVGCKVHTILLPPGEGTKTLGKAEEIFHLLSEYNITRGDLIVALGGGVVGDLAGFCASTYLRGLDFIQIPTSLLAQVDSSIGGKVGVNLSKGKNLVGSFYQPKAVIVDPRTLETLDKRVFGDGMAEVIKYGCIQDPALFQRLSDLMDPPGSSAMTQVVETCCTIKRNVIQKDERETGLRRILNFGHTLGHVVETYFNYQTYTHGEAVAMGMAHITMKSELKGITRPGTTEKLKDVLKKYELPYTLPPMELHRVEEILLRDKKFSGSKITLILLKDLGEAVQVSMDKNQLMEFLY